MTPTPSTYVLPAPGMSQHDFTIAAWILAVIVYGGGWLCVRQLWHRGRPRRERRPVPAPLGWSRRLDPVTDDYARYMHSARWARKRAEYWRRYGYRCRWPGCGERATDLHHACYDRFGRERLTDLVGLCHPHHAMVPTSPHPSYQDQAEFFGINDHRRHALMESRD